MARGKVSPEVHRMAWWNTLYNPDGSPLTRDDIEAFNLTPLQSQDANGRRSEGLILLDDLRRRNDLWIGWDHGGDWVSQTPIGKLAQLKWAKGANDQKGEWGGFDWYDVQFGNDWPVYMSTPTHQDNATVYFYPVNGGKYQYASSRFRRDPTVMATKTRLWLDQQKMNQEIQTGTPSAGTPGTPGADPYSYGGGMQTPAVAGRASGVELTFVGGRIWYATTAAESASRNGPHPGLALAGPQVWDRATFGTEVEAGLPSGIRVITVDDPADRTTIRPAVRELRETIMRAQDGDTDAANALNGLGIGFNRSLLGWLQRLGGLLDRF